MAAPIQGAQIANQVQQQGQKETQLSKLQESKFDGVMSQKAQAAHAAHQVQGAQQAQAAQQVSQAQRVSEVAKADKAALNKTHAATRNAVEGASKADGGASTMMKMVSSLEHGQANVDKMIQMAVSGKNKLNFQQLTVLQMQVYQYSQEMELTSKVVEKATNGLKDTLKTQV